MASGRDAELSEAAGGETFCARHPKTETALRCSRCGTPICPRCLIQTPVGARCPTCANVSRVPTLDVSPVFILRGVGAALASGAAAGALWGYAFQGFLGFFIIFLAISMGWAVSESVSLATNRKRSVTLQAIAIGGVVLAFFVHNLVLGYVLPPTGNPWAYIATGVAAFYAYSRLKF